MKLVFLIACIGIAVIAAPPKDPNEPPKILKYADQNDGSGNYTYAFVSEDGIERQEQGLLFYPNTENETYIISGAFSYTGPDGIVYKITYQADGAGYHPKGSHLPPELPIN